jgi:hypothetical protein
MVASPSLVAPGDTFTVELLIVEADEEFNAFDVNLGFDPARVAFVPTTPMSLQLGPLVTEACPDQFHIFNAAADQLSISVSLLCAGVVMVGPGAIYQVRFRAGDAPGETVFGCEDETQFYRAGFFVNPLECLAGTVRVEDEMTPVEDGNLPDRLHLGPPVPNPSSGGARFSLMLRRADTVQLELFDLRGRRIARRAAESYSSAGWHELKWDPQGLPPGVYLVRLITGSGESAVARWTLLD